MDLKTKIQSLKLGLGDTFLEHVNRYKKHLFKWNAIHNLSGVKDETTLDSFIFDAIYPLTFLPHVGSILDIGSGAGFPGLILAMAMPDTKVVLVEPLTKRASFLQFVKADLALDNVFVEKKRVEEFESDLPFELITSRAVTDTKMLLDLSKHVRNSHSRLLFYKGKRVFDELDVDMPYKIINENNRHYLLMGENI